MSKSKQTSLEPTYDEMESLFVNNENLDRIESFLNRFNPIKIMKMQRMEIRHSAILAWLLDPAETHGLGDHFLRMFLSEALRGQSELGYPTALDISQSDLRDSEVRCEWQNIDIFILSRTNNWAFIIENKFDSKQSKDQLSKYMEKVEHTYGEHEEVKSQGRKLVIRGIFLSLWDEEPQDQIFSPIRYDTICEILELLLSQQPYSLSTEMTTFLKNYLDILEDATGMSAEHNKMEELARQLYRDHKKILDFVVEHGTSTDFATAARALFGDNPETLGKVQIGKSDFVFSALGSNIVSFLPLSWYQAFGEKKHTWSGCENWWAGYPLIAWMQIWSGNDGTKGRLGLYAEVGPISDHEFRKELIESIQAVSTFKELKCIKFQTGAANEGKKSSKFLKQNIVEIKDIQDPEQIEKKMKELLVSFQPAFEAIVEVLPDFCVKCGNSSQQ